MGDERMSPATPEPEVLSSPAYVQHDFREGYVRELWLEEGFAVKYTSDEGVQAVGYIIKVYADTAQIVPLRATVGDDSVSLMRRGRETKPLECREAGQMAKAFEGRHRGKFGKVVVLGAQELTLKETGD